MEGRQTYQQVLRNWYCNVCPPCEFFRHCERKPAQLRVCIQEEDPELLATYHEMVSESEQKELIIKTIRYLCREQRRWRKENLNGKSRLVSGSFPIIRRHGYPKPAKQVIAILLCADREEFRQCQRST